MILTTIENLIENIIRVRTSPIKFSIKPDLTQIMC